MSRTWITVNSPVLKLTPTPSLIFKFCVCVSLKEMALFPSMPLLSKVGAMEGSVWVIACAGADFGYFRDGNADLHVAIHETHDRLAAVAKRNIFIAVKPGGQVSAVCGWYIARQPLCHLAAGCGCPTSALYQATLSDADIQRIAQLPRDTGVLARSNRAGCPPSQSGNHLLPSSAPGQSAVPC